MITWRRGDRVEWDDEDGVGGMTDDEFAEAMKRLASYRSFIDDMTPEQFRALVDTDAPEVSGSPRFGKPARKVMPSVRHPRGLKDPRRM